MAGEGQDGSWVIRPSLWFDAVSLVTLVAGLPFYTSRHEHDVRFSLRYGNDDHIARELDEPPLPAQAVIPPARPCRAGPEPRE